MKMKWSWDRLAIRSAKAQLAVLGVMYAGAVVLAVAALTVRSAFFERFVREKLEPISEATRALARGVIRG